MLNDSLNICTAVAKILTRIKMIRMLYKMLTDACSHAQTKVGVNVDLADSALCSLAKLIFRNADCVNQLAAVLVDDLDIFLRNRRRSVKNDRESGKSSGNLFQNIQTKLRLCAGLELISAVRSSDCNCKRINTGLLYKLFNLFRMSVECLICLYGNSIFLSCQSSKLSTTTPRS